MSGCDPNDDVGGETVPPWGCLILAITDESVLEYENGSCVAACDAGIKQRSRELKYCWIVLSGDRNDVNEDADTWSKHMVDPAYLRCDCTARGDRCFVPIDRWIVRNPTWFDCVTSKDESCANSNLASDGVSKDSDKVVGSIT